jgi:hypothetical protein
MATDSSFGIAMACLMVRRAAGAILKPVTGRAMETPISIKRLSGSIGAEIKGVDLKPSLDDPTFPTIHQAFLDRNRRGLYDEMAINPARRQERIRPARDR